jgi:hypothetical protein
MLLSLKLASKPEFGHFRTLADVGHFVQEDGQSVARAALRAFGDL